MTHKHGTSLGGIATLEGLRLRCACDDDSRGGCWHLRTARGRPQKSVSAQRVWIYGIGSITATQAAWMLSRGERPKAGMVVRRACESYDCVNPAHLSCITAVKHGRLLAEDRRELSPAQRRVLTSRAEENRKITRETKQWLLESSQSHKDVAHGLGISSGRAAAIRGKAVAAMATSAPSIFALGDAMNSIAMRRAA